MIPRIAYLFIPHFLTECEILKASIHSPFAIAEGDSGKSLILDDFLSSGPDASLAGLRVREAKDQVPNLRVIPVDDKYLKVISNRVVAELDRFSPEIECLTPGHFYVDLTGTDHYLGRPVETGIKIIRCLDQRFGFHTAVGIGTNKLVSYLAGKCIQAGVSFQLLPEKEQDFMDEISVTMLPDLSEDLKGRMVRDYNITRLKELRALPEKTTQALFGKENGGMLYDYSHNQAARKLTRPRDEAVIGDEIILMENDDLKIYSQILGLLVKLCTRLRKENLFPSRYTLTITYFDEYQYSRQKSLRQPNFFETLIYPEIKPWLAQALERRVGVKKVHLSFYQFREPTLQYIFFEDMEKYFRRARAFDSLRERFGEKVLKYGGEKG